MLVNVFLYVPNILLRERFEGAVLAIPIGVLIGTTLLFLFTISINKFKGVGLPELLEATPKWFRFIFVLFFSGMWFIAGAISLLAFNNVTIRFINPEISDVNMITVFAIFIVLLLVRIPSDRLLYTLEIILVLNLPLIGLVMYQAYSHDYLSIYSMLEVATHYKEIPSWSAIAASTFVFSGYTNLVIFYRVFKEKIRIRRLWFVPIIGFVNLVTTIFIPIGMWGADGIGDLTYPWIATADTLQIEFGPVERVVTMFILLYVSISMISVAVHWHVAFETLKSTFHIKLKSERIKKRLDWIILGSFALCVYILELNLKQNDIFVFGENWLNFRLPCEVFLVLLMIGLSKKVKQ